VELQSKLQALYGTVDNIDPWIGGLAEDHLPGTSTGELLRAVILDQFQRARDGDRFWYQTLFTGDLLAELESITLRDIIARNTVINNLQDNVFFFQLSMRGTVFHDLNADGIWDAGEPGILGQIVRLFDADTGAVLKRMRTNPNGNYQFTNLKDGLEFGSFRVRVVVQPGWTQTTPNPPDVLFTKSADVVADFGLTESRSPGSDFRVGTTVFAAPAAEQMAPTPGTVAISENHASLPRVVETVELDPPAPARIRVVASLAPLLDRRRSNAQELIELLSTTL
jgi:hypothetical protein